MNSSNPGEVRAARLGLAVLLLGATGAYAADVKIERLSWAKDVGGAAPIRILEVHNDFGDIRARLSGEPRIEASAVVQRLDPGPQGVGFTVERRGEAVVLTAGYPPGRVRDTDPDPPKASYDRLDFVVYVPEGVTLIAHTIRGIVEGRGLKSDVAAATLGGNIFIATSGAVRSHTRTGDTIAILAADGGTRPLLFESDAGAIQVTPPPAANLDVRAETAGEISSDYPLQQRRVEGRNLSTGSIGQPRRPLLLSSRTGRLEIRRPEG